MGDSYNTYWDTYKEKVSYHGKIATCLKDNLPALGDYGNKRPSEMTSMLSVGSGEGDLDVPLLTDCLTAVREYYGVEIRQSAADVMEKRLKEFDNRTFQTQMSKDYIQQYPGPPKQVDFILVGHVLNYVVDEFVPTVEKLTSWLTPRGCLVLSHLNPVNFFFETERILQGRAMKYKQFTIENEKSKANLREKGWTVKDYHVDHSYDLSVSDQEIQLLLRLTFDVDISSDEMKQIKELIDRESSGGKGNIPYNYEISLIFKSN